jgi:hypothetical protein
MTNILLSFFVGKTFNCTPLKEKRKKKKEKRKKKKEKRKRKHVIGIVKRLKKIKLAHSKNFHKSQKSL